MKVRVTFAVLSASRVAATLVPKHRVQKRKNHRRVGNKRQATTSTIVDDEEQDNDNESPSPNLRKLDDMNWKRTAKSFERDVVRGGGRKTKDEIVSDVGVLAVKDSRNLQENESSCPEDKVIVCEKGIATSIGGNPAPPGTSCKDACDGQCCVGGVANCYFYCYSYNYETNEYEDCFYYPSDCEFVLGDRRRKLNYYYKDVPFLACEGLTASICQDNVTCIGKEACTDAEVGSIYLGCNGEEACKEAGKGGYLGTINNGCEGKNACTKTGYKGNVTLIQNSCRASISGNGFGSSACANAASGGGKINRIIDSCVSSKDEDESCFYAASNGGYIGDIIKSCNQVAACKRLASGFEGGGYVLGLNDSCNACNICDFVGRSSNPVNFTMDTCCNDNGLDEFPCGGCSGLGGNDLPAECQILPPSTSPSPTSPAPTISAAPSPDTVPEKQVNGASQGKYDEGNAQGGNNGKGYGVGGDPKAADDCSNITNKKAKKKCLSKLKKAAPWN